MDLLTKEFISAPEFSRADIEALKTYFGLNKKYSQKIEDELVLNLNSHKVWGPLIKSMSPREIWDVKDLTLELQHAAIYEGKWEEYSNALIFIGRMYARMKVRYADWYELVKMYKALLLPHLKKDFADACEDAIMFLDGISKLSDYTLFVIAEAYFKEKNETIKEQEAEARKADVAREVLLNRISDGVVSLDNEWHYTFINDTALATHPGCREEILGRHIWDVHPQVLGTVFWDKYQEAMLTKKVVEIESYYPPMEMWFSVKVYPSSDGLTIFYNDITERKRVEAQMNQKALEISDYKNALDRSAIAKKETVQGLINSEKRLSEAQAIAHLGNWELSFETGIAVWSEETCRIYNLLPEEKTTQTFESWIKFIHPDDMERVTEKIRKSQKTLSNMVLDHRILLKDGTIKYIEGEARFEVDKSGRPVGLYGIAQDVTEKRIAEEILRQRESRLNESQAVAQMGSWEIDIRQNLHVWSHGMYTVFGIPDTLQPSVELFLSVIHPDDRAYSRQKVETAFNTRAASSFDFRFIKGNGDIRFGSTEYYFEFDKKAEPTRLYGVVQDTTEREAARRHIVLLNEELEQKVIKRTEELEFTNKELESFSYSVSHDLRAPIRAINGYAVIMEEDYSEDLTVDGLKVLHLIKDNSKKMGELIDDLLAFSKLGRKEVVVSEVNMNELVNSLTEELLTDMDKSKIEVSIGDLHNAMADHALIRQVWINLISNAIKYAKYQPKTKISIGSDKMENSVVYHVKDNGIGFDMQYYDVLFGVFQRLHSQEEYEGTGIGLAIVQKIVHRHHGIIWAKSKPGEGANFFFSLPFTNLKL